jgi:hypothetical protein
MGSTTTALLLKADVRPAFQDWLWEPTIYANAWRVPQML